MNKDDAKDFLPLVQALAEGKIIQYDRTGKGDWRDEINVTFIYHPTYYRIKPEPIKKWYRVALLSCGPFCAVTEAQENLYEDDGRFIKWLTPRVEYIVEE